MTSLELEEKMGEGKGQKLPSWCRVYLHGAWGCRKWVVRMEAGAISLAEILTFVFLTDVYWRLVSGSIPPVLGFRESGPLAHFEVASTFTDLRQGLSRSHVTCVMSHIP